MTADDILELARESKKGDWQIYSRLKIMLDESLSAGAYTDFVKTLAEVLEL